MIIWPHHPNQILPEGILAYSCYIPYMYILFSSFIEQNIHIQIQLRREGGPGNMLFWKASSATFLIRMIDQTPGFLEAGELHTDNTWLAVYVFANVFCTYWFMSLITNTTFVSLSPV